jgi:predicted ester cyclase
MTTSMTTSEAVVRDYLRARETADLQLLDEVVAPGFVHRMLGIEQDRAGLFAEVGNLPSVFADMHHDIEAVFTSGDQVACQYTFTARHIGPIPLSEQTRGFYGSESLAATGRQITLTGMFIAEVRDGRLHAGAGEYDRLTLLTQLSGDR